MPMSLIRENRTAGEASEKRKKNKRGEREWQAVNQGRTTQHTAQQKRGGPTPAVRAVRGRSGG